MVITLQLNRLYTNRPVQHSGVNAQMYADRRGAHQEVVHIPWPLPVGVRVSGYALEHHSGDAVRQRAVYGVGVTGDPATVRDTAVDVSRLTSPFKMSPTRVLVSTLPTPRHHSPRTGI